jgi:imidazolonepropionase-like amidohydrolase
MGVDFIVIAPPYTFDEIKLATEEAHRFGVMIAAEGAGNVIGPPAQTGSYEYPGTRVVEHAVRARVDVIEHLYPMEEADQVRQLMKKQGTIVVPTVAASERHAGPRWAKPTENDVRWKVTAADFEDMFRKMHAAGVKMSAGTDATGAHRGQIAKFYARELELFVQWGMTPHQAIQSATRIGAETVGLGAKLGTLEPGKLADLIVVPGNPLNDVTSVTRPRMVMKDGVMVR